MNIIFVRLNRKRKNIKNLIAANQRRWSTSRDSDTAVRVVVRIRKYGVLYQRHQANIRTTATPRRRPR